MKNLMMLFALIIGINAAKAQNRGDFNRDPEARAKAKVDHLDKELNLTKTQKDSIHSWVLGQAKSQQSSFRNSDKNTQRKSDNNRSYARGRSEETNRKIANILDNNQKQKFEELQKKWTEKRSDGEKKDGEKRGGRNRSSRS